MGKRWAKRACVKIIIIIANVDNKYITYWCVRCETSKVRVERALADGFSVILRDPLSAVWWSQHQTPTTSSTPLLALRFRFGIGWFPSHIFYSENCVGHCVCGSYSIRSIMGVIVLCRQVGAEANHTHTSYIFAKRMEIETICVVDWPYFWGGNPKPL